MTLDPQRDLSPGTVEALDGLLLDERASAIVSDADLLALLRDTLAPEERERALRHALVSPSARRRLMELHRQAARLSGTPVGQWDEEARAALYVQPARDAIEAASLLSPSQWSLVVHSGEARFAGLRAVLALIADHARLALSAPRFSAVRGTGEREPGGGVARMFIAVTADGALSAQATTDGAAEEGRSAILEMVDPLGGGFPIAASTQREGHWSFRAEGFGALTGMPLGPLPSSIFRVRFEDEAPRDREPGALWAPDGEGGLLAIDLMRPPHVASGELTLVVQLPEAVRRAYADRWLAVMLPLGRHEAILGRWPVSGIRDVAVLRASVFDVPDGDIALGSILKARLTDGGGD